MSSPSGRWPERTPRWPADSVAAVRALLGRDPEALIVARDSSTIVGTVIAGWDGWRAHLYRLAVHPQHRRRGIATSLLDAAEARLSALEATRFDAMVLDGNDLGQAAWVARGYERQPDWSRWVRTAPPNPRPAVAGPDRSA
ncbi:MAG: GNAT family N-acetyltransferase [Ilumatobacteraceae bacterium]